MFEADSSPEEMATRIIRDYCGWHVAPIETTTITIDGTGTGTILLPSRRVTDVEEVKVHGEVLPGSGYEWSQIGAIRRLPCPWPDAYRSVEVTFTHGFDDMSVLADVMASIVARVAMDRTGAIANQRAGTQSVTFASGASGSGLLASEKELLEPYRLTWGP